MSTLEQLIAKEFEFKQENFTKSHNFTDIINPYHNEAIDTASNGNGCN